MGKSKTKDPVLDEIQNHVRLTNTEVSNTTTYENRSSFASQRGPSDFLEEFKSKLSIQIQHMDENEMIFDLVGVDPPFANALRRILLSEVPTMAIERIFIRNNTSVIQDEVLSHRLGLIPILADPEVFEYMNEGETPSTHNTIVFKLNVTCTRNPGVSDDAPSNEKYTHGTVYSGDLKWIPQGEGEDSQASLFAEPIKPVHDDIVIAKMRPGQCIDLEAFCCKGTGKVHAKWSPVCTASYRLLPVIKFNSAVTGENAKDLVKTCPLNVFDIEDIGGVATAVAARPRDCSVCRECIREEKFENSIRLLRKKDHFIFSVESTGVLPPQTLVRHAVAVLKSKCSHVIDLLAQSSAEDGAAENDVEMQ
eukprot:GCRY01001675.1.p1 GENE.GCRY01001675.1~~GCRY01001675.1.p1  ORF type:complete len:374 (+),score=100.81 GCRY01001675.1:31-1122(+)